MTNPLGVSSFQCFTPEQVKEINEKIRMSITSKESPYDDSAIGVPKRGSFSYVPCPPMMDLLHPWMYNCQTINLEYFGYDIYWNFHLDKFTYNEYGEGGEYQWHADANRGEQPVDIKLTCILNLSEEPYEGGDFYTILDKQDLLGYPENEPMKFTSGQAMVFNPLLAHKVTPVTKGKRITLAYWATGPSWR